MYGVALSPRRAVAVRMGIDAHDRQHSPRHARVDSLPPTVMDRARGLRSAVLRKADGAEANAAPVAARAGARWAERKCRAAPALDGQSSCCSAACAEIGRASCRERVEIAGVAGAVQKNDE